MIYSIIDIGTNSVRYMLAKQNDEGILVLKTDKTTTRLGEGLYVGNNCLTDAAMARTVAAVKKYSDYSIQNFTDKLICVATSAVRDADNKLEFAEILKKQANIDLKVLSGEEEACYGFEGALFGVPYSKEDVILVDIGGGSTEITGLVGGKICADSFNCGCVRLKELFGTDYDAARRYIESNIYVPKCGNIVWIGGTASSVAMIQKGLTEYSIDAVHMTKVNIDFLNSLLYRVMNMSNSDLERLCAFDKKRSEILVYGLMIIVFVAETAGAPFATVSENGLMDGIILNFINK